MFICACICITCVQSMKDALAPSTSPATLYKTQNTYLLITCTFILQHLLNHLLNNFHSLLFFLPTVEKYQRGEKILFVEKNTHAEV